MEQEGLRKSFLICFSKDEYLNIIDLEFLYRIT